MNINNIDAQCIHECYIKMHEMRSNPQLNKKETVEMQLNNIAQKYNKNNIFGRFSGIPKLGINPRFNYSTPLGMYAYPLDHLQSLIHGNMNQVAYAGEKRYLIIFTVKPNTKLWIIKDGISPVDNNIIRTANKLGLKIKNPNNSAKLYKSLWKKTKSSKIIRKIILDAGIDGVVDYANVMHPADPIQAWFPDISHIQVIDIIDTRPQDMSFTKTTCSIDLIMDFMEQENDIIMDIEGSAFEISSYIQEYIIKKIQPITNVKAYNGVVSLYKTTLNNVKIECKILKQEGEDEVSMSMILIGDINNIMQLFESITSLDEEDKEKYRKYILTKNMKSNIIR